MDEALEHLGNVLYFFADIHPDHRCEALDNALAFYNAKCPNKQVKPSGLPLQLIVQLPFETK